jgi:predicted transcriptional regulator
MLEALLGSVNKEKVLIYIFSRESGYAREIAEFYNISLTSVVNQLKKLEEGNVIYAQMQGRTKVYKFNLRFPFLKELKSLLEKVLEFYPEKMMEQLKYNRKRPRRSNKPV